MQISDLLIYSIIDNLIKYTAYSKGEISLECDLHYEDIEIDEVDFSPYDLNNSYFGGVTFKNAVLRRFILVAQILVEV